MKTNNTNTAFAPKQIVVEKSNYYCLWFIDDISQSGKYLILKSVQDMMAKPGSFEESVRNLNARVFLTENVRLATKPEVLQILKNKELSALRESEEIKFIISAFENYSEKIKPTK